MRLDHDLTMGDKVVRNCKGLLGMLRRVASTSPSKLLRLAYISLIRSQLEYSSAVMQCAAPTHIKKLDCIQRMAARIIVGAPRDAHSDPIEF